MIDRFVRAKAKRYSETTTPTTSSYCEGMHKYYRWFHQDSFTRKCIITNAYFATMTAGFETVARDASRPLTLTDSPLLPRARWRGAWVRL